MYWMLGLVQVRGNNPSLVLATCIQPAERTTGLWAIEFAEAHANAEVTGTDLSPIQPSFIPPNCRFIVDNAEHDWAFDRKFDYVHSRMLTLGMHDWPRFFKQCWDNLEPGGWLETSETQFPGSRADGDATTDSALAKWGELIYEAAAVAGIDARASEKFTQQLESVGFINVQRVDVQWPIGPWPKGKRNKIIGKLLYENVQQAIPSAALKLFTTQLGWSKGQVDELVEKCLKEVDDKSNHFYFRMCLHVAQKPAIGS